MFHVLNATYCDVYATKDKKQLEYAGLLLTANTKVELYDGGLVSEWLGEVVSEKSDEATTADPEDLKGRHLDNSHQQKNLIEFFRQSPLVGLDDFERDRSPARDIDL